MIVVNFPVRYHPRDPDDPHVRIPGQDELPPAGQILYHLQKTELRNSRYAFSVNWPALRK